MSGQPSHALVGELQARCVAALGPALAGVERLALLDYPNHVNVGDASIYLGELRLLAHLGHRPDHVADQRSYSRRALLDAVGRDGVVLLHGGGNLGTLYPKHQRLRERVLAELPDHRVILLPQSMAFLGEDQQSLERARTAFRAHKHLTVFLRDRRSLQAYEELFGLPAALAPDSALFLGPLARRTAAERDVGWLSRRDEEAVLSAGPAVHRFDWGGSTRPWHCARIVSRVLSRMAPGLPLALTPGRLTRLLFDRLAEERLRRAEQLLPAQRVVVTDRLHGHILCLLLDLPHVVLDSLTGKSRAFYETWTSGASKARFADSPDQALVLAAEVGALEEEELTPTVGG